jgi:hypothetical protein
VALNIVRLVQYLVSKYLYNVIHNLANIVSILAVLLRDTGNVCQVLVLANSKCCDSVFDAQGPPHSKYSTASSIFIPRGAYINYH